MPIVITAGQPAPPEPPKSRQVVEVPEVGYASISFTDPSGTVWPLTDQDVGWFTLADGVSGMGAARYALTSDPHPRGGARLRHVQAQPRTIVWPLMVQGVTHQEFTDRWRRLARAFTSTLRDGPGVLEVVRPDGGRRQTRVYYQEGFEGQGRAGTGINWDTAVLTLFCEDPYWVDPVPQSVHREYAVGEDFFQPFPSVSSGQVLGATTVTNPGDVVVWPEWTITGPASLITFTNEDTGESFSLNPTSVGHGNLLAGERATVSTDPARVRYQDGANWIGSLDWPGAQLWGLQPGISSITFQLDGSGTGSAVDLTYYPRYETA